MTLRLASAALVLALLPLSGCDETGSTSSDPDVVLGDARALREAGRFDEAVALLDAALVANPGNASVSGELAATLLARNGLNLLDLGRVATYIVDGTGGAAQGAPVAARGGAGGGTCFYETDTTATPFDPRGIADFSEIAESQEDVERAIALIAPFLPAALKTFDTCTAISPAGDLTYDRAAVTAQLRATGLSDPQIGQMLATNSLARVLSAYYFVTENLDQETQWFRLADGRIAICVDDEDALRAQAETAVTTLGTAVLSLDTRARSFGGETDIVDLGLDAFDNISEAFFDFCEAGI